MNDINITLLTEGQVFGDDATEQLKIFKIRGTKAAITDWAIVLGGYVKDGYYASDRETVDNRACWYYLKDRYGDDSVRSVNLDGDKDWRTLNERDLAVRAALPFSKIKNICSNIVRADDDVLEADLGLLPAELPSRQLQNELNKLLYVGKLTKLSSTYTTDSRKCDDFYNGFRARKRSVYEYKGIKYMRVKVNSWYTGNLVKFNNGEKYKDGDYVWLELKPVRLWIDEETDTAVFEKGVVAGLQFNNEKNYYGNFEETDLGFFLNNIFLKEILQFNTEVKSIDVVEKAIFGRTPKKQNIIVLLLKRLMDAFPFLKSILGSSCNQKALLASSTELALVPEEPKEVALLEDKKEKSKLEISNEKINELCDYIKEKSLLLVPSKRKDVLESLNQLLDNYNREMDYFDSDAYIKYNLSLTTPEGSKLTLWDGLNRLKLDVDTFLLDNNNILNYGEDYIDYLSNLFEEYSSIEDQRIYNGMTIRVHATKQLLELINKIECDFDNITPYFRDEILKLIFLTLNSIINIPWESEYSIYYEQRNELNDTKIADKLILWFEGWYKDNKDKLDDERQRKYLEIKMTMSKENKFAYIVELAKLIDLTLITSKEDKKGR